MSAHGKRYAEARGAIDREKLYAPGEAVATLKALPDAKFDETVEISMNLGVDPRHADQMVRGVCNLPNGSGRTVRVRSSPAAPRRTTPARRVPTSSAPRISSRSSRAARSSSIAASRPRT